METATITNQISEERLKQLKDKEDRLFFLRSQGFMKSTELKGGNILDNDRRSFMYDYNMEPEINHADKYWHLEKVLKTDTWATHWLIKMHDKYFICVQGLKYKIGPVVQFFNGDKKGKVVGYLHEPLAEYTSYVDMETACDLFAYDYIATRIEDGRFENLHIFD